MDTQIHRSLDVGDIIKHKADRCRYVVTGNYGGRVTAVKTVDVTNPSEWQLVNAVCTRKNCNSG